MNDIARHKNPNRDRAFEIYKEHNSNIKLKDIAEMLGENVSNIRTWKNTDKWDSNLDIKRKKGGQKHNNNALGNDGGAPKGNFNGVKTGEYLSNDRFMEGLPTITRKTVENNISPYSYLELLWFNIQVQSARIITMQKIAHVKNKKDMTKEIKKISDGENSLTEYELQFAWDKENNNIIALSRAMDTLSKMIDRYDKMIHANWNLVTEEQKVRIEVLKSKLPSQEDSKEDKLDKYFEMLEKSFKHE